MLGFVAFYVYSARAADDTPTHSTAVRVMSVGSALVLTALCALRLPLGFVDAQAQRALVTLLTAAIVALRESALSGLTASPLVQLGDSSYSVYLVHWPLLVAHRYRHAHSYVNSAPDWECE